ncbi:MAG: hypothetical protein H0X24_16590 [Ktedonobacterales bacterium]|nr:hypothetical protein [Ktedonobacterales bacterium]
MSFRSPVPTPVVFERTDAPRTPWEYHVTEVDLRESPPLSEAALNDLGRDGWLLAGLFEDARHSRLHYHFVRAA